MRRISAPLCVALVLPSAALAGAQFTADDIIRHFKQGAPAHAEPAPAAARPAAPDDDEPIRLPLTGAKRAVTLGNRGKAAGTTVGATVGTGTAAPTLDLLITFESGSDRLTEQARRNLDAFAEALKSPVLAGFGFEVQGHTDAIGSAAANMVLSQRRAESVVRYLVARGIATGRLRARGYGETRPIMSDPSHPRNRRVETRRIR